MAISLDDSSKGSLASYGAASMTWAHTVGAGSNKILIVGIGVWQDGSGTVTGVTFNGDALTQIRTDQNGGMYSWLGYLVNPDEGEHDIVASFTGSGIQWHGGAVSLFGVDQSDPLDAQAGSGADGLKTNDTTVTVATDDAWMVAFAVKFGTETLTPHADTNELQENGLANSASAIGYRGPINPAAATEIEWTWITNDRDSIGSGASFVPASDPVSTFKPQIIIMNG